MNISDRQAAGRSRAWICFAVVSAATLLPPGVGAQSVSIESGATWQMGDATADLDCVALNVAGSFNAEDGRVDGIGNLDITGQLAAATAPIEVGGNWNNQGSFLGGTGTVLLSDRCNASAVSINGNTSFATLLVSSTRGKEYQFTSGQTQSVAQTLRLAGVPGARILIRSSSAGTQAGLALSPNGQQQIDWVDVSDMAAPDGSAWLAPGPPENFNSLDSGNNYRWFEGSEGGIPVDLPATSRWNLLALGLALAAIARRYLRFR